MHCCPAVRYLSSSPSPPPTWSEASANALKKLSESESQPVVMDEDACAYLAESAGGDLRKALGCLDFVVTALPWTEPESTSPSR